MIVDSCRVSLPDWTTKAAVEVYPGGELASMKGKPVKVMNRTVAVRPDVVALLLSNGKTISGTADQELCRSKKAKKWFVEMGDVEIGEKLIGMEEGVPTVVYVVGTMRNSASRMVELETEKGQPFVVEGIVAR